MAASTLAEDGLNFRLIVLEVRNPCSIIALILILDTD
jgi:hypothetical protein